MNEKWNFMQCCEQRQFYQRYHERTNIRRLTDYVNSQKTQLRLQPC